MTRYSRAEGELKELLKLYTEKRGGFWSPIPQGTVGSKKGDPDLVICYKGRFIGCEAKAGTDQHGLQPQREREIRRAGGIYFICKSVNDLKAVFDSIDEEESKTI